LAQWVIEEARSKTLPVTELRFDYQQFGKTAAALEPYLGKSGWLAMSLLSIETFGESEDHLVMAAQTHDGKVLPRAAIEMLMTVPVASVGNGGVQVVSEQVPPSVLTLAEGEKQQITEAVNQRSLGFFAQEIDKLEGWADDQKQGLEQQIKDLEKEIREVRKGTKTALTLEEKLQFQKQQRELESKRNKLRKELFDRQDEVDVKRDQLIVSLEEKLVQKISGEEIFTVKWSLK
jgi:hypothetical protein